MIFSTTGLRSTAPRETARSAAFILPNNAETEELVLKLGAAKERIHRLAQSFLSEEGFSRFCASEKNDPKRSGRLEIVAGGNLEGRKGVAIAIRALAILKSKGVPFRYRFFGRGPELGYLRRLVKSLGLDSQVSFLDPLGGGAYVNMLKEAHVYLLPSLREGVPVTQMEAMAAGCVPVVAACGGAGPMAEHAGMNPVAVQPAASMATPISLQLERLWNDTTYWNAASNSSAKAIREHYSADHYAKEIDHLYANAATACGLT
jgi:glycosyltransferase involved in cell wall biosynthesis